MPFDGWEAAERLEGGWKLTSQKGTFPAEIATHHCHSQKQDDQKLTAKEPHLVWQSMSWADHRSWLHMISLLLWRRTRTSTCQKGSVRKGWNPSRTSPESSYQDLSHTCACEQISLYEAWNAQVLQVAKICISSTFSWQGILDHNNCIILRPSTSWGKSLAPLSFELWEPGIAAIATDSAFQSIY